MQRAQEVSANRIVLSGFSHRTKADPTAQRRTSGAERGLDRFEGFSDAVFAIALTLLIVEIKVPGSPNGPDGYSDLARTMAHQCVNTSR